MKRAQLRWYLHRLGAMSPLEIGWRLHDQAMHGAWKGRQVHPNQAPAMGRRRIGPGFPSTLPPDVAKELPPKSVAALIDAANLLLRGSGEVLGVRRTDLSAPDWFTDPITGRRAPQERYAFRIDHRSETETGNVKQVWELSRLQHLTILAGAWFVTGDGAYADAVARQLRSWWRENPFLSGVHWTSGIEVGVRLITWVWVRRLLSSWPGAPALFEDNPTAIQQVYWHQRYLSVFRSRGSSANNHVIAEAVGQLVASCAFPWFAESERWRAAATTLLETELEHNTFPDGLDREQASDYHGFVAELGLVAAVELVAAGKPLSTPAWERLCLMIDAAAAFLDETLRAPRQGDSDEGRALLVDPPGANRWEGLLAVGSALFGPAPWWPPSSPTVSSTLLSALGGHRPVTHRRPERRPSHFPHAGLTLLRTAPGDSPEIWCRCDGGPHGFLAIAGHAHADALSLEVRCGGIDILADPGTYCYHGEPEWRWYFRSTIGHNTLELGGQDQSLSGGPFLWLRHAPSRVLEARTDDDAPIVTWTAEHHGYEVLDPPATHRRSVQLHREERRVDIVDHIDALESPPLRMAFHLGPIVRLELHGSVAQLQWPSAPGVASAQLQLADGLRWSVHRGECQPILGWYSASFGRKEPTTTLIGVGRRGPGDGPLRTSLCFSPR
ncbi:MAG TPA: alginate lyase family protein [Acidimicrobiales bacterium]|nr:alginate lyase family protein [Acidimicrobiales bacterium]